MSCKSARRIPETKYYIPLGITYEDAKLKHEVFTKSFKAPKGTYKGTRELTDDEALDFETNVLKI